MITTLRIGLSLILLIITLSYISKTMIARERRRVEEEAKDYLFQKYKRKDFKIKSMVRRHSSDDTYFYSSMGYFYWVLTVTDKNDLSFEVKQKQGTVIDYVFSDDYIERIKEVYMPIRNY